MCQQQIGAAPLELHLKAHESLTDMGEMSGTLGRRGQWTLVVVDLVLAGTVAVQAVSRLRQGNILGAVMAMMLCGLLTWAGVRRVRLLRGWVEPPQAKRLFGTLGFLYFGTALAAMTIVCFASQALRDQFGSAGADVAGTLAAVGAMCLFVASWMVWTGRTRVPSKTSSR